MNTKQSVMSIYTKLLLGCCLALCGVVHAASVEVTYYHHDLLGSPVAATNEAGELKWRKSYQPYGAEIESPADSEKEFVGYTGHRLDKETGLVYAGARHYDPVIGRFMGVDPVGFLGHIQRGNSPAHGFNRYAYANNNPYKYTDPDGKFCVPCAAAVVGGAINTAVYFATTDTSNMTGGEIAMGAGKAFATGAVMGAATSIGLGSVTGAVATASVAGTIGAGVEAGSQIASSGSITSGTAVVASGVGNAVGAVVGGAAAAPIAKGLSKALSTAPTQGTGKAITSLSGKVFPPVGASAGNVVQASTGAVTVLSETAGGVAGAAAATAVTETRGEFQ